MYLRTTKRKNKDGSEVTYYQLAHNERHPRTKKPIAKIIHRFGRADKLDRSELTRLCQSIARVCGLEVHDPLATNESKSSVDQVGFPRELNPTTQHTDHPLLLPIASFYETNRIGDCVAESNLSIQ